MPAMKKDFWAKANPEKRRAWLEATADERRKKQRAYYAVNRDKIRDRAKVYNAREDVREAAKKTRAIYYLNNREKQNKIKREYQIKMSLVIPKEKQMWQRFKYAFCKLYQKDGHCLRIETWTQAGVPDCYLMVGGKVVWLELKRLSKPRPLQKAWHAACVQAGGRAVVLTARAKYVVLQSCIGDSYLEEKRYPWPVKWPEIVTDVMGLL